MARRGLGRREFLKAAGGGAAAAGLTGVLTSTAAATPDKASHTNHKTTLTLRAATELPEKPLHSHFTHAIEGSVDLATGSGLITTRVLAGPPPMQGMALPGLTRVIRVTQARSEGQVVRLQGHIEDRATLRPGQSPNVQVTVDLGRRLVHAPRPDGSPVAHRLL
ncbi:MAG TPA: twin-arginine translocation signal domain-containing protein [Streptosporangiaceae bacterium]|nr:twin-arginine translocation signal domain-containing protein [Streptosporangiaceae bacterium]